MMHESQNTSLLCLSARSCNPPSQVYNSLLQSQNQMEAQRNQTMGCWYKSMLWVARIVGKLSTKYEVALLPGWKGNNLDPVKLWSCQC